jgi:oxaloacetate decarboxylase alpha subunit
MNEIEFLDQTMRDAQQSLWGFRMSTESILPIAPVMDQMGYKAICVNGGRGTVVAARYLKESLFERFRLLSRIITKTPLRSSFVPWSAFGFDIEPLAPNELWIKETVASGIRSFWVCDYQNMMDRLEYLVGIAKAEGAEVIPSLMYTLSPVHTDELYAQKAKMLVNMGGVDAIHVEDAGGILTPERIKTLLPAIEKECKGVPIEIHAHCNTGLAPLAYLEAIKMGARLVHTAVSPLANGSSLPSTENILKNVRRLGYSTNIDEDALKVVSDHFMKETAKSGMEQGMPVEHDVFHFEHQVPGGMMGTLKNQLIELGMEGRLDEVLEEVSQIRKELGYPVMATPYSQIVGAQAVFNITTGERYKIVSDEVIKYTLGYLGKPEGPMDQNVLDKILGSPKAKNFINWKPADITIDDLRKIEPGISDEQLLLHIANPEGEFKAKLHALYGRK